MGMSVEAGGHEIWDPAARTAAMFLGQIRLLETLIDTPSGIAGPENDFVYVDASAFRTFLTTAFRHLEWSQSRPMRAMLQGVFQVALALDVRANGSWLARALQ